LLTIALAATGLGLFFELVIPASAGMMDVAAALFALATWIAPALMLSVSWNKKPKSSLAGVGFAISVLLVAASLSIVGLSLALLTLIFARGGNWAWLAILTIAAFWPALAVFIAFPGRRRDREARERAARDAPSRQDVQ
jgi:hypothetical protein